jgi:hypothetical protein
MADGVRAARTVGVTGRISTDSHGQAALAARSSLTCAAEVSDGAGEDLVGSVGQAGEAGHLGRAFGVAISGHRGLLGPTARLVDQAIRAALGALAPCTPAS